MHGYHRQTQPTHGDIDDACHAAEDTVAAGLVGGSRQRAYVEDASAHQDVARPAPRRGQRRHFAAESIGHPTHASVVHAFLNEEQVAVEGRQSLQERREAAR